MLTSEILRRIRADAERPCNLPPDIAEAIEDVANRWVRIAIKTRAQSETRTGELVPTAHIPMLERLIIALSTTLITDDLPGGLLGLFDGESIWIQECLKTSVRQPTLAHEASHVIRPHAGHDEIRRLMRALLCPQFMIEQAQSMTIIAITQMVPWPLPLWIIEARIRDFSR